MREVPRCDTCQGVKHGGVATAMASAMMMKHMLDELVKLGMPAELLAGARTWSQEHFRTCSCGPSFSVGPF